MPQHPNQQSRKESSRQQNNRGKSPDTEPIDENRGLDLFNDERVKEECLVQIAEIYDIVSSSRANLNLSDDGREVKEEYLTQIIQAIYGTQTDEPTVIRAQRVCELCQTLAIPVKYWFDCVQRIMGIENLNRLASEANQIGDGGFQRRLQRKRNRNLVAWAIIVSSLLGSLANLVLILTV
jgi:hypothetical protein